MTSPIKEVLKTLHHHAEVVEHALHGVIGSTGTGANPSIAALRQVSALRAAGEDGYRLHPRLREYLHDHLQLFPAFQSLAEIGSRRSGSDSRRSGAFSSRSARSFLCTR